MRAFVNGILIVKDELLAGKVLVFDDTISKIVDEIPTDCEIIDLKGAYVSAGLIDVHIHGFAGYDVMDADVSGLQKMCDELVKFGVTSFCPTTMTQGSEQIKEALTSVKQLKLTQKSGAQLIGVHLEGPYISKAYKGAQNPNYIVTANFEDISPYKDLIKIITLAPEIEGMGAFIEEISQKTDITVSIGHSAATFEETLRSMDHGVSHATHLFNAMTGLHHRDPGVVGAVLMNEGVKAELIADLIHVHPALFDFIHKNKSDSGIVLVSDSMRAGGMEDGDYDLGGQIVIVRDKCARLESGALAGSVLTLNEAVKNMVNNSTISLPSAIRFATKNPAEAVKIDKQKGSLCVGKDADFVVWDESLNVLQTYIAGECVYSKNENV